MSIHAESHVRKTEFGSTIGQRTDIWEVVIDRIVFEVDVACIGRAEVGVFESAGQN